MVKFGEWDAGVHSNYEQVQRILSAQEKKMQKAIIESDLSGNDPHIVIQGSGEEPYTATLNECTCSDFAHRHLPCKHIYALAFLLDLMGGLPEYKSGADSFDAGLELDKYRELYEAGMLKAAAYVQIGKALSKIK